MKKLLKIFILLFVFTPLFSSDIIVLTIDGAIDPPIAEYICGGIEQANNSNSRLILILLDTPGGLMSSMKNIVNCIIHSDIPVSVFVYPKGARAASAGVFISMSSNIAAMAPGTHLGAAHPVSIGIGSDTSSTMKEKVTNDAIAWLRSLAQLRKRNPDWAERTVKFSESITASEAESLKIIDLTADNIDDLIAKINHRKIAVGDTTTELDIDNPHLIYVDMNIPQKFLHTILNPNLAYLLLILGLVCIYLELQHPGAILPGVLGVISLFSAFYAFQILPVNYIGVLFIIAGIIMFILEIKIPGFGLLTTGGIVSMLFGSFMLTSGASPEMRIDWWTIVPTVLFIALLFIFVIAKALLIQTKKVATGYDGLIGEIGEVIQDISPDSIGKISAHGEIWNAKSDESIKKGEQVEIVKINGMLVRVKISNID
ncbi:nodulation protein NfeD [bacterium]|nr:nodulation protein NfeD [bacterium]